MCAIPGVGLEFVGSPVALSDRLEEMSAISHNRKAPDWMGLVAESLKQHGPWHTHARLLEARASYPDDLSLRGYLELVRNTITRDFLAQPKGLQAIPKLSSEFLTSFDRFNLTAQEGYLISLIDGRLPVQKLIILSPFDPFNTLFILAKLQHENAITVPR
jgi:hypothetical protein